MRNDNAEVLCQSRYAISRVLVRLYFHFKQKTE